MPIELDPREWMRSDQQGNPLSLPMPWQDALAWVRAGPGRFLVHNVRPVNLSRAQALAVVGEPVRLVPPDICHHGEAALASGRFGGYWRCGHPGCTARAAIRPEHLQDAPSPPAPG